MLHLYTIVPFAGHLPRGRINCRDHVRAVFELYKGYFLPFVVITVGLMKNFTEIIQRTKHVPYIGFGPYFGHNMVMFGLLMLYFCRFERVWKMS